MLVPPYPRFKHAKGGDRPRQVGQGCTASQSKTSIEVPGTNCASAGYNAVSKRGVSTGQGITSA
eukprot:3769153-Rhodomonas_salina.5